MDESSIIIGNQEWCALPELGVHAIKVRVDSGAATSAIHAFNIEIFEKDIKREIEEDSQDDNGLEQWVRYELHPLIDNDGVVIHCESKLHSKRRVKSSNGETENRYAIRTPMKMAGKTVDINITLTNRDEMGFRMLLGRQAMEENVLISPAKEFLFGDKTVREIEQLYASVKPGNTLSRFFSALAGRLFSR